MRPACLLLACLLVGLAGCCQPTAEPDVSTPPETSKPSSPVDIDFALVSPDTADATFQADALLVIRPGQAPVGVQPRIAAKQGTALASVDVTFELLQEVGPTEAELDYQRLRGLDLAAMRLAGKVLRVPTDEPGRFWIRVEVCDADGETIARDVLTVIVAAE